MPSTTRLAISYPGDSDLITNGDEAIQTVAEFIDTQGVVYLLGTLAARPAASAVVARMYIATDTAQVFVSTGATWILTSAPPIGTLMQFAGAAAPDTSWLLCDGAAVSRSTYATLFALISTTYGAGNGSTTFNVPDGRGRTLVGVDGAAARLTANDALAGSGGFEKHLLLTAEMPSHAHGAATAAATIPDHIHYTAHQSLPHSGSSGYVDVKTALGSVDSGTSGATNLGSHAHTVSAEGGGGQHNNMQPFLVVNHIIRAL